MEEWPEQKVFSIVLLLAWRAKCTEAVREPYFGVGFNSFPSFTEKARRKMSLDAQNGRKYGWYNLL